MKKVYRDKSLGYSDEASFGLPADYNPCFKEEGEENPLDEIDEVFE